MCLHQHTEQKISNYSVKILFLLEIDGLVLTRSITVNDTSTIQHCVDRFRSINMITVNISVAMLHNIHKLVIVYLLYEITKII